MNIEKCFDDTNNKNLLTQYYDRNQLVIKIDEYIEEMPLDKVKQGIAEGTIPEPVPTGNDPGCAPGSTYNTYSGWFKFPGTGCEEVTTCTRWQLNSLNERVCSPYYFCRAERKMRWIWTYRYNNDCSITLINTSSEHTIFYYNCPTSC